MAGCLAPHELSVDLKHQCLDKACRWEEDAYELDHTLSKEQNKKLEEGWEYISAHDGNDGSVRQV